MQGLLDGWAQTFSSPVGMSIQKTDAQDSDRSVGDTVALMGRHVVTSSSSPQVQAACRQAGIQAGMRQGEIVQRVFSFIKSKVRFVEDETQLAQIFQEPNSKELLITPPVLLSMRAPQGDCDDFSMLCCSMLRASGVGCSFVTVAADRAMPDQFTHVYCVAYPEGKQIWMDCSHGKVAGWETPKQTRKQIWPIWSWGEQKMNIFSGLGDCGDQGTDCNYPGSAPVSSGGGIDWNNIIPGIFTASEKLILQTTQQPGYQTVGPNGSTSYVLAPGQSASGILNIPGTSAIGSSSTVVYLALGLGALLLFSKMAK